MNYYQTPDGRVHAFDSGYKGPLITADMKAITKEQADVLTAPIFAPVKKAMIEAFKIDRERYVNRLAVIAQRATRESNAALASACDVMADALLAIPKHANVTGANDAATLEAAIADLCAGALEQSPAALKTAYAKFDK